MANLHTTPPPKIKPPPWIMVKFRMPDDLVDAVIIAADQRIGNQRIDGERRNVSAMIRTILREELQRPPPPTEIYAPGGRGDVYNIRMPAELLKALHRQVELLELPSLSTLIRAMLRRWLTSKTILTTPEM